MLFASFGFFEGMARIMDLRGTLVNANESLTPKEADARAILSDWETVGQDMGIAIEKFAHDREKE